MLKYKINIADALERKGFNTYKAKTTSGRRADGGYERKRNQNRKKLNNL